VLLPVSYFPNKKGLVRGETGILVIGRLRRAVSLTQARTGMAVVARRLEQAHPDSHAGRRVELVPLHRPIGGCYPPALLPWRGGGVPASAGLDGRVMAFALVLTAATGLCFGLVPAVRASRTDLDSVLKEAGRGGSGAAGHRFRDALVVAEVTCSLVLLVGAGL